MSIRDKRKTVSTNKIDVKIIVWSNKRQVIDYFRLFLSNVSP